MGIIPDKFVNISVPKDVSVQKIKANLIERGVKVGGDDLDQLAEKCYTDDEMNQSAVLETFTQFVYTVDATDRQTTEVLDDMSTMLKLRFRNNAPKRPPQVIMIGPPGSGKTT